MLRRMRSIRDSASVRFVPVAAILVSLAALPAAVGATPPVGHVVLGLGGDACVLKLAPYGERESFIKGSAWVGIQASRQLTLQLQGDTWQHGIRNNTLMENARDAHLHGWSTVAGVRYAPCGGPFAILGGAGVAFADLEWYAPPFTRLGLLLGLQCVLPAGPIAIVPRVQVLRISADSLHNPKIFSVGLGIEWY